MTIDNRQKCELPAEGLPTGLNYTIPFGLFHTPGPRYCQTVPERGEGGIFLDPLHNGKAYAHSFGGLRNLNFYNSPERPPVREENDT